MIERNPVIYKIFNLIWILLLLVVGYFIYKNAIPVLEKINYLNYGYLLLGIFSGTLFCLPSVWILHDYLNKYNLDKSMAISSFLMFVPAIGKYVPGKIWVTGSFIIHAKKLANMPAEDVIMFQVYFQVIGVGSTLLMLLAGYIYGHDTFYSIQYIIISLFVVVAFFALIFYFRKKTGIIKLELCPSRIFIHIIAFTFQKMLRGISLLFFIMAFTEIDNILDLFYSFIIAMQAGVLAFFAPAGLGVTEGTYMVMLSPRHGVEFAILVALISRLWSTVTDFLLAITGYIIKRVYLD